MLTDNFNAAGKTFSPDTALHNTFDGKACLVKPDILSAEDIMTMLPMMRQHPRIVESIMRLLWIDRCNAVHGYYCSATGAEFSRRLVEEQYRFRLEVKNEDVLSRFPDGAFITVSNHPFGSYDGIILIYLLSKYRPDFKVMVNLILNKITAMQPSFIAVDAMASDDPAKKKISMEGIREAIRRLKEGHPVGFFPAGAVSKLGTDLRLHDRQWQPTVTRIIQKARVPVIPIYFHGHNSTFFNILGIIDWRLRTLRLPRELFNATGKKIRITIGQPIMPDAQARCQDIDSLGKMLRQHTYDLRNA